MARAINQTVAWITASFLSILVFGVGLAIVMGLQPKHKELDSHERASEKPVNAEHGKISSDHSKNETHTKTNQQAPEKTEHQAHSSYATEEAEEHEITASSVKAKASKSNEPHESVPEAKPHH